MIKMYSIKIFDRNGTLIGELPTASAQDIMRYINKGFVVKDLETGRIITLEDVSSVIGASDGFIDIG